MAILKCIVQIIQRSYYTSTDPLCFSKNLIYVCKLRVAIVVVSALY
jgi:hypothetical protein